MQRKLDGDVIELSDTDEGYHTASPKSKSHVHFASEDDKDNLAHGDDRTEIYDDVDENGNLAGFIDDDGVNGNSSEDEVMDTDAVGKGQDGLGEAFSQEYMTEEAGHESDDQERRDEGDEDEQAMDVDETMLK